MQKIHCSSLARRAPQRSLVLIALIPLIVSAMLFSHPVLAGPAIPVPEMVPLPGGETEVGSLVEFGSEPVQQVTIAPFAISRYEITFEQFDAYTVATGRKPLHDLGWGRGSRPAVGMSWHEADEYARWLSEETGRQFRLPTEAEWEYAARGGSLVAQYSWGDAPGENNANCRDCGSRWDGRQTAPVGSFAPNAFGLHDMHGNVWEWAGECYGAVNDEFNIANTTTCDFSYIRGGSWDVAAEEVRVWHRTVQRRGSGNSDIGVRLVEDLP